MSWMKWALSAKCFVATCGDRGIDNDFRDVNDWQFFKGAQKLGELGQPVLVHCEKRADL